MVDLKKIKRVLEIVATAAAIGVVVIEKLEKRGGIFNASPPARTGREAVQ